MRHIVRDDDLVVGNRVVVRHRLPDGSASDALGDLLAVDARALRIATRRGEVDVDRSTVLAAKAVPPPPRRRLPPHLALDAEQLLRLTAGHWRAREEVALGEWVLRFHDGFSNRANSALALGDPGLPPADAVAAVEAFSTARGIPAVFTVPGPVDGDAGLGTRLGADGWAPRSETLVLTAALDDLAPPDPRGDLTVHRAERPDDDWLAHYRGGVPPTGVAVLCSAPQQVFVTLRRAGRTVAVGRGSTSPGWLGVSAVEVDPGSRRQGLATRVLAELVDWGASTGARSVFLQVTTDNAAARTLYARAGFVEHSRYHYRRRP